MEINNRRNGWPCPSWVNISINEVALNIYLFYQFFSICVVEASTISVLNISSLC